MACQPQAFLHMSMNGPLGGGVWPLAINEQSMAVVMDACQDACVSKKECNLLTVGNDQTSQ